MNNGIIHDHVSTEDIDGWKGIISIHETKRRTAYNVNIIGEELKVEDPLVMGRLKNGKLDGPVRMFGQMTADRKSTCKEKDYLNTDLSFMGEYKDGKPNGYCWKGIHGGGFLYGLVNAEGDFTGGDIAYIYPDIELALVGQLEKEVMVC